MVVPRIDVEQSRDAKRQHHRQMSEATRISRSTSQSVSGYRGQEVRKVPGYTTDPIGRENAASLEVKMSTAEKKEKRGRLENKERKTENCPNDMCGL